MPFKSHFYTFIIFVLSTQLLSAQQIEIFGTVTDSAKQAIDEVNVVELGTGKGTSTNESGMYTFSIETEKKTLELVYSHVSYVNDTILLPVANQTKYQLDLVLQESDVLLNQVEISGNKLSEDRRNVSTYAIDPVSAREVVSPFSDFNSVLFTLPGVVSNNELSSSYNVRGGNFDENLVLVNDIPIYRPTLVRSGQQEGLSFVNPDMVEKVNFSAGGWGSQFGDKVASVLDITYKNPEEFSGRAELSLLGGSAHIEGRVNDRLSYSVGFRHKNSRYLLNSLEVEGQYLPNFSDIQGLFNYGISPSTNIGLLVSYATNNYEIIPESQQTDFGTFELPLRLFVAFDGIEKLTYNTWQSGIFVEKKLGKLTNRTILSGYYSFEREFFEVEGFYRLCIVQSDISQDNFDQCLINRGIGANYRSGRNFFDIAGTTIENKSEIEINAIHKVEFGAGYTFQHFDDSNSEYYLRDSADYVSVVDQISSNNKLDANLLFAYGSHDYQITPRHNLTYGLRLHYHSVTEQFLLNPRLQYSYQPTNGRNIIYRFAAGVYHQPPFFREYKDKQGNFNTGIKAQSSAHFIAGFDWEFQFWGRPFKFTGEGYYKNIWNAIPYDIDNLKIRYYGDNMATAFAAGIDFRLSGEFIAGDQSWFSLGLLQTKENIEGDGLGYVPRPTNQLLNAAIFFQDHIPNLPSYKVNLTLFYNSPLPFYPPNSNRATYFRGEKYQRLDIGFTKDFSFRKNQSLSVGVEILNLTNNANIISYSWIQDVSGSYFAVPNSLSARYFNMRLRYDW